LSKVIDLDGENDYFESFLQNCTIIPSPRDEEKTLFKQDGASILCALDNYAIVPRELFDSLMAHYKTLLRH